MSRFIRAELKSDSDLEPASEVESKSDAELMTKIKLWFWISHFADFGQVKKLVFCQLWVSQN